MIGQWRTSDTSKPWPLALALNLNPTLTITLTGKKDGKKNHGSFVIFGEVTLAATG